MDTITQRVIEFLTHPELPFGTEEDQLLLEDPAALRERVGSLLDEFPEILSKDETEDLKARLDEAAWSFVALEFQARLDATASFFDADAEATTDSES